MHSLIRRKLKKYILIIVFQLITLILWIYAKYERGEEYAFGNIPIYLSQIFALWGLIFFSINYFIATRMQSIEYFFGGLDKVYKFHRFIGESAFVMILAHPILLAIDSLPHLIIVKTLFIPFIPSGSFAKSMGIISLYIYAILILITIFRFLPYNIWKLTHKLMGIPFFFAAIHGLMAESDVKHVFILRYWILFWIILGIVSYIYKIFLYDTFGPKLSYEVISSEKKGEIGEIYFKPLGKRISFEPGEFVFLKFKSHKKISSEAHPFTISSSTSENLLRISYKILGDYTSKLYHAKKGDKVEIFGPYGEFSSYVFNPYKKQIWIAAGIGVTPFLSMLKYESLNEDKKTIHFYYCGKNEESMVYTNEIEEIMKNSDDNIKYQMVCSSNQERLSAAKVAKDVKNIKKYLILICGPVKMMQSLKKELTKMGVDENLIVFEDFGLV